MRRNKAPSRMARYCRRFDWKAGRPRISSYAELSLPPGPQVYVGSNRLSFNSEDPHYHTVMLL